MIKSKELGIATKAARESGRILMENYGRVRARYKADRTLVTNSDIESEKNIKRILKSEFPDYSFITEESRAEKRNSEYTWIIDPLDGTTNYTIHNPFFCVSIALAYKNDPVLGVVYYPFARELFYAERGRGAYLNGKRIRVSKETGLENSFLAFCHKSDPDSVRLMADVFRKLKSMNEKIRQIGAAALELSYVASGRIDSFMMINLNLWDVSAGALIVKEAKGKVTDFDGREFNLKSGDILATNGKIHNKILEIINQFRH